MREPIPFNDKEIHQMWFSITNECNNKCKYCFVKKRKGSMDYAVLDRALEILFGSSGKKKKIMRWEARVNE